MQNMTEEIGKMTLLNEELQIHWTNIAPLLTIRNERGDEVARRIVGVGAMQPDEQRSFSLAVEVAPAIGKGHGKRSARH